MSLATFVFYLVLHFTQTIRYGCQYLTTLKRIYKKTV